MKFEITRASDTMLLKPGQPCQGAVKQVCTRQHGNELIEAWHWFIDIDSLEALLALLDVVEESIIVGKTDEGSYEITIYNDFDY